MIFINDERTLDLARETLHDIGELSHVSYRIGYLNKPKEEGGNPTLIIVFDYAEAEFAPALSIMLTALSTGRPLKDDTLKRAIRNATEQYLKQIGVPRMPLVISA